MVSNVKSLFPQQFQILSGSVLKLIAVITMLIDHTASTFLSANRIPLFTFWGHTVSLYLLMRWIGRMAFPIYAFLLVEGFLHTRNRLKYGVNLLLFAVLSEIPWNLLHSGKLLYANQNVFFTLFLGYVGLWVVERYQKRWYMQIPLVVLLLFVTYLCRVDYECKGVACIILLYLFRDHKLLQAISCVGVLVNRQITWVAFIPINLYNGERGFIKGKALKYAFYAFYPVHILILYLLRFILFM